MITKTYRSRGEARQATTDRSSTEHRNKWEPIHTDRTVVTWARPTDPEHSSNKISPPKTDMTRNQFNKMLQDDYNVNII